MKGVETEENLATGLVTTDALRYATSEPTPDPAATCGFFFGCKMSSRVPHFRKYQASIFRGQNIWSKSKSELALVLRLFDKKRGNNILISLDPECTRLECVGPSRFRIREKSKTHVFEAETNSRRNQWMNILKREVFETRNRSENGDNVAETEMKKKVSSDSAQCRNDNVRRVGSTRVSVRILQLRKQIERSEPVNDGEKRSKRSSAEILLARPISLRKRSNLRLAQTRRMVPPLSEPPPLPGEKSSRCSCRSRKTSSTDVVEASVVDTVTSNSRKEMKRSSTLSIFHSTRMSYGSAVNHHKERSVVDRLGLLASRSCLFFPLRLETILFSAACLRVNRQRRRFERFIVVTLRATYVLRGNENSERQALNRSEVKRLALRRRIAARCVDGTCTRRHHEDVVISVVGQASVWLRVKNPDDLVSALRRSNPSIDVRYVATASDLADKCIFRDDPRYQWKGDASR